MRTPCNSRIPCHQDVMQTPQNGLFASWTPGLRTMDGSHAANIHVSDRTIDSHIRNIRAKFAAAGCTDVIATVHGVGFRLGRCGA